MENRKIILASGSPRRKQLLTDLGFEFTVEIRPTDERFPPDMPVHEVPAFLAVQKAKQFEHDLDNNLVLCADTVVIVDNQILNKPADVAEATAMLTKLSGRWHEAATGVCLLSNTGYDTRTDIAKVYFRPLKEHEIAHYITHYRPFDKAGGYGIQEWISMIGIERIEGSYYTIMGLPVHLVYDMIISTP